MQLVRHLLLLHVGVTAALILLLSLLVVGQRLHSAVAARRPRLSTAPTATAATSGAPAAVPAAGASVLEWTVDLRGVEQREPALRT
jgi:hypothetical protein